MRWLRRLLGGTRRRPRRPSVEAGKPADLLAECLLGRGRFAACELLAEFPPLFSNASKEYLFQRSLEGEHSGYVEVLRLEGLVAPIHVPVRERPLELACQSGFFDYPPPGLPHEWHLNFADSALFGSYGAFPFAQDEIQVAEHPVLACVREALRIREDGLQPLTVAYGEPTPVLIRGVQRRIAVDTSEIYGQRFRSASREQIVAAIQPLDAPTISNILALEAPVPRGEGHHSLEEIRRALTTAYSGFRALVLAGRAEDESQPLTLHTGFWGCGAYGGNLQLMSTLQILAAELSGLDRLVFHTGSRPTDLAPEFRERLAQEFGFKPGAKVSSLLSRLAQRRFPRGMPDGN
jgi:hypothetical protein